MKLKDWLERKDWDVKRLSKESDICIDTIYRWLRGQNKPLPVYIAIIHKITDGKVTKKDWEL